MFLTDLHVGIRPVEICSSTKIRWIRLKPNIFIIFSKMS